MLTTLEWILLFNSLTIVIAPWVYPNSRLPRPTMAMAVGSLNHTIFLLGGNPSPRQMTKYHTESDSFVYAGGNALPINTSAMGQGWTQQGNILYLVDIDFPINLAMYHMNTQQFTTNWTNLPIEIGPHSCLASSKDTLFVVGGRYNTTAYHNKLQILNLTTLQWTNNPPSMNDVRTQAACIVANDYLWAFGGRYDPVDYKAGQLASNERVELNNITQNTWVYVDSLTTALTGLRAVVYKDTIYVIGGNAHVYHHDIVHLMDTQTGALTGTDHLPFQTSFSSPIVAHNVLYVFGGQNLFQLNKWAYFNFPSPTTNPSTAPTRIPSVSSSSPSFVPSAFPSIRSIAPSKLPTSGPSDVPSIHPTNPSLNPSVQPSWLPIGTTGAVVLLFNETYAKDTQIQTTYIVSIAAVGVFLCIVLCVLVYKKHKSANMTLVSDIIQTHIQQQGMELNGQPIANENKSQTKGTDSATGIDSTGHQTQIIMEINREEGIEMIHSTPVTASLDNRRGKSTQPIAISSNFIPANQIQKVEINGDESSSSRNGEIYGPGNAHDEATISPGNTTCHETQGAVGTKSDSQNRHEGEQ